MWRWGVCIKNNRIFLTSFMDDPWKEFSFQKVWTRQTNDRFGLQPRKLLRRVGGSLTWGMDGNLQRHLNNNNIRIFYFQSQIQSNLCTTTTLGGPKIVAVVDRWSLFRGYLCIESSKWDHKMVVVRERWSLFGGSR